MNINNLKNNIVNIDDEVNKLLLDAKLQLLNTKSKLKSFKRKRTVIFLIMIINTIVSLILFNNNPPKTMFLFVSIVTLVIEISMIIKPNIYDSIIDSIKLIITFLENEPIIQQVDGLRLDEDDFCLYSCEGKNTK